MIFFKTIGLSLKFILFKRSFGYYVKQENFSKDRSKILSFELPNAKKKYFLNFLISNLCKKLLRFKRSHLNIKKNLLNMKNDKLI